MNFEEWWGTSGILIFQKNTGYSTAKAAWDAALASRADVCGSDNGFLKAGYNWVQYGYELYDKGNGHIGVKRIGFDPEPQNVSDNSKG